MTSKHKKKPRKQSYSNQQIGGRDSLGKINGFTSQQILPYTGTVSHPSCPLSEEHEEV